MDLLLEIRVLDLEPLAIALLQLAIHLRALDRRRSLIGEDAHQLKLLIVDRTPRHHSNGAEQLAAKHKRVRCGALRADRAKHLCLHRRCTEARIVENVLGPNGRAHRRDDRRRRRRRERQHVMGPIEVS